MFVHHIHETASKGCKLFTWVEGIQAFIALSNTYGLELREFKIGNLTSQSSAFTHFSGLLDPTTIGHCQIKNSPYKIGFQLFQIFKNYLLQKHSLNRSVSMIHFYQLKITE